MTLLTLLQTQDTAPVVVTDEHDVFAPDYTETAKRVYPLKGEVKKRKRLKRSVVKKVKILAQTPEPTLEQLTALSKAAMPQGLDADYSQMALKILAELNQSLNKLAIESAQAESAEAAEKLRQRIIIEGITEYAALMELDELLLIQLI